jgi:hypothetical protein
VVALQEGRLLHKNSVKYMSNLGEYIVFTILVHLKSDLIKMVSEWMSDCCLMPTQQFFSYIMVRTSSFSIR